MKSVVAILVIPFIEIFLLQTGLGSVVFAIAVYFMLSGRFNWKNILFITILSLISDVMLKSLIGSNLLAIVGGCGVVLVFRLFVRVNDGLLRLAQVFVSIIVMFIILLMFCNASGLGDFGSIIGDNWGYIIRVAIVSTGIYLLVELIYNLLWGESSSNIKLKQR